MQNINRMTKKFLAVAARACCECSVQISPDKRICRDAFFGTVCNVMKRPKPVKYGRESELRNRIVLILESPHIVEYRNRGVVWPMQGRSGANVRLYLEKLLPFTMRDWGLFVVNAVRYQCSQGLILSRACNLEAKNFVVGNLLKRTEFRNDFVARIQDVIDSADRVLVLNACTKYKAHNVEFTNKEIVTKWLNGVPSVRKKCFNEIRHPSYWNEVTLMGVSEKIAEFSKAIGYL